MGFVVVVLVLKIIVFLSSVVGWSILLFRFLFCYLSISCCCHSSFGCDHALRSQSNCDDHDDVLLFMGLHVVYVLFLRLRVVYLLLMRLNVVYVLFMRLHVVCVLFLRLNVTRSSADSGCLHTAPHLGADLHENPLLLTD